MPEYYKEESLRELSDDWIRGRQAVFLPYMNTLTKLRKLNTILDVGAGPGLFLSVCKNQGWTCSGIEPSSQCRTLADTKFGLHLDGASLENSKYADSSFDVITFWNVLDHLPNPKETLAIAHRLLRPGGMILIRCPNAAFHVSVKRLFQIIGRRVPSAKKFDQSVIHSYSFSKQTLTAMLTSEGFQEIVAKPGALAWTTTQKATSSPVQGVITLIVEIVSSIVFALSMHKSLIAPSFITTAQRPPADSNPLP